MNPSPQVVSIDEFIKQVEDLWGTAGGDHEEHPLTSEQRAELDRRLDAYALNLTRIQPAPAAPGVRTLNRFLHGRRRKP